MNTFSRWRASLSYKRAAQLFNFWKNFGQSIFILSLICYLLHQFHSYFMDLCLFWQLITISKLPKIGQNFLLTCTFIPSACLFDRLVDLIWKSQKILKNVLRCPGFEPGPFSHELCLSKITKSVKWLPVKPTWKPQFLNQAQSNGFSTYSLVIDDFDIYNIHTL